MGGTKVMRSDSKRYEIKVILIAIAEIVKKSKNIQEVYEAVAEMANAEGVILKPLEDVKEG